MALTIPTIWQNIQFQAFKNIPKIGISGMQKYHLATLLLSIRSNFQGKETGSKFFISKNKSHPLSLWTVAAAG
jgi:hypothetical protein